MSGWGTLTLYVPKSLTVQASLTVRPAGTVMLPISFTNSGSRTVDTASKVDFVRIAFGAGTGWYCLPLLECDRRQLQWLCCEVKSSLGRVKIVKSWVTRVRQRQNNLS